MCRLSTRIELPACRRLLFRFRQIWRPRIFMVNCFRCQVVRCCQTLHPHRWCRIASVRSLADVQAVGEWMLPYRRNGSPQGFESNANNCHRCSHLNAVCLLPSWLSNDQLFRILAQFILNRSSLHSVAASQRTPYAFPKPFPFTLFPFYSHSIPILFTFYSHFIHILFTFYSHG